MQAARQPAPQMQFMMGNEALVRRLEGLLTSEEIQAAVKEAFPAAKAGLN